MCLDIDFDNFLQKQVICNVVSKRHIYLVNDSMIPNMLAHDKWLENKIRELKYRNVCIASKCFYSIQA